MKSYMSRIMVKHFPRSGLLIISLLLVVSVTPPMLRGGANKNRSANQRTSSHALTPSDWLEQKVTAKDGIANDSLGWSVAIDGNTAVVGAPNATVNGHSS